MRLLYDWDVWEVEADECEDRMGIEDEYKCRGSLNETLLVEEELEPVESTQMLSAKLHY